jgi:hypothetical protein
MNTMKPICWTEFQFGYAVKHKTENYGKGIIQAMHYDVKNNPVVYYVKFAHTEKAEPYNPEEIEPYHPQLNVWYYDEPIPEVREDCYLVIAGVDWASLMRPKLDPYKVKGWFLDYPYTILNTGEKLPNEYLAWKLVDKPNPHRPA